MFSIHQFRPYFGLLGQHSIKKGRVKSGEMGCSRLGKVKVCGLERQERRAKLFLVVAT
jgi:hypothetical protein